MNSSHATLTERLPTEVDSTVPAQIVHMVRLHPEAVLPSYHSAHAAGMDLSACLPEGDVTIDVGQIRLIPCGFAMAIPHGYEGQVRPRSGLATRFGISIPNAPGTVDSDYRGEAKVALINLGTEPFLVKHRMRIAQLVISPVSRVLIREMERLDDTPRGSGGFGSTGL